MSLILHPSPGYRLQLSFLLVIISRRYWSWCKLSVCHFTNTFPPVPAVCPISPLGLDSNFTLSVRLFLITLFKIVNAAPPNDFYLPPLLHFSPNPSSFWHSMSVLDLSSLTSIHESIMKAKNSVVSLGCWSLQCMQWVINKHLKDTCYLHYKDCVILYYF